MLKGADRRARGWSRPSSGLDPVLRRRRRWSSSRTLNTVWEVETTPGSGVWRFARTYMLSLAGVLALGFLLLTSLLLTAALARRGQICRSLPAGGRAADRGLRPPRLR